jgi:hypothetical protein
MSHSNGANVCHLIPPYISIGYLIIRPMFHIGMLYICMEYEWHTRANIFHCGGQEVTIILVAVAKAKVRMKTKAQCMYKAMEYPTLNMYVHSYFL